MKKAKFSGMDNHGAVYVDCSECNKGGNGKDTDKCSCGWKYKKGGQGMCFSGTLIDELEI